MSNTRPALSQKVGIAAAFGAALTGVGCSSDSDPEPQTHTDAGAPGSDALSELMQEGSAEDVADALEEMLDSAPEGSGGTGGMAPAYKGVTFS